MTHTLTQGLAERREDRGEGAEEKGLVQRGRIRFCPLCAVNTGRETQEDAIRSSGLRIRVVERTRQTLKNKLQRSNPFNPISPGLYELQKSPNQVPMDFIRAS